MYCCRFISRKSGMLHLSERINKIESFLSGDHRNNTNYEMKEHFRNKYINITVHY